MVLRIHSYFHFVFPKVRNYNISKLVMYYVNYIHEDILLDFEEAKLSGNDISIDYDENGINIKVSAYKDVFFKMINNIFSIILNQTYVEKSDYFNYKIKRYRSIEEKANGYLGTVMKKALIEHQEEYDLVYITNQQMLDFFEYNANNMYTQSLIYGDVDKDIINKMKTLLSIYEHGNSREIEKQFKSVSCDTIDDVLTFLSKNAIIKPMQLHRFVLKENFNGEDRDYYIAFIQIGQRTNSLDILSNILIYLYNNSKDRNGTKMEIVYKDQIIYLRTINYSFHSTPYILALSVSQLINALLSSVSRMTIEQFGDIYDKVKRIMQRRKQD